MNEVYLPYILYILILMYIYITEEACKHAVMCQYQAGTGPMLAESAKYWPGAAI